MKALFELLRPPNVFTAVADAAAGLVIVRQGALRADDPGLWLLGASACLYLGGMALNDVFDRELDSRERPERPIPSGRVSPGAAAATGFGFLVAGVALAIPAGRVSATIAILLAMSILFYDAFLKDTPAGPLAMGTCRGLNFALPFGVGGVAAWMWTGPFLLAAFVAFFTALSRLEVTGGAVERTRPPLLGIVAVAACLGAMALAWNAGLVAWALVIGLLARWWTLHAPLWNDARAPLVGRAIGGSILSIPLFDGAIVAAAGHLFWGVAVASLSLPAILLKRWYSPT